MVHYKIPPLMTNTVQSHFYESYFGIFPWVTFLVAVIIIIHKCFTTSSVGVNSKLESTAMQKGKRKFYFKMYCLDWKIKNIKHEILFWHHFCVDFHPSFWKSQEHSFCQTKNFLECSCYKNSKKMSKKKRKKLTLVNKSLA